MAMEWLFCCLLLFIRDLSDREMKRYLSDNPAIKWSCGLTSPEPTPNYSLLTRVRMRTGPNRLPPQFATTRALITSAGPRSDVFTFVDAMHPIAKTRLRKGRDKARQQQIDKLHNGVLLRVVVNKQTRFGGKGKMKYWCEYKEQVSVVRQSGLRNKMVTTPGNLPDAHGLRHVCHTQGTIYGVKGEWSVPARSVATPPGGHLITAPRNNRKNTKRDHDRCYPHLRVPDERFFAQHLKRVRYGVIAENQFAAFLRATALNFQRLPVPEATPLGA